MRRRTTKESVNYQLIGVTCRSMGWSWRHEEEEEGSRLQNDGLVLKR